MNIENLKSGMNMDNETPNPFKQTKEYFEWAYEYDESHSVNVTLEFLHSDQEMYEAFLKLNYGYMTYRNNNPVKFENKDAALRQAHEKAKQNGFKPFDPQTDTIRPLPEFVKKEFVVSEAYKQSKQKYQQHINNKFGTDFFQTKSIAINSSVQRKR